MGTNKVIHKGSTMKTMAGVLCAVLLTAAGSAAADEEKSDAFPQGWYVAPMFSYTRADKERLSGNGKGGMFEIGHRGDIAAIELGGIYTNLSGAAKLSGGVLNLMAGPFFQQPVLARLFAVVGFGVLEEKRVPSL